MKRSNSKEVRMYPSIIVPYIGLILLNVLKLYHEWSGGFLIFVNIASLLMLSFIIVRAHRLWPKGAIFCAMTLCFIIIIACSYKDGLQATLDFVIAALITLLVAVWSHRPEHSIKTAMAVLITVSCAIFFNGVWVTESSIYMQKLACLTMVIGMAYLWVEHWMKSITNVKTIEAVNRVSPFCMWLLMCGVVSLTLITGFLSAAHVNMYIDVAASGLDPIFAYLSFCIAFAYLGLTMLTSEKVLHVS